MATESDRSSRDTEGGHLERVCACVTGRCACVTGSCAISAIVGPLHRKWRHQSHPKGFLGRVRACATGSCAISDLTSPVALPLEVTWSEVPLGCSLGRPRPIIVLLPFPWLSTPFPAILLAPSIITFLTKVCCFRICCVVLQVVYHVRVAFLLYFQRSFNVLFINCSFLLYFFVNFLSITTFLDSIL